MDTDCGDMQVSEDLDFDMVLAAVMDELDRASKKFPDFRSAHEGYAILKEEVDELWDAIKANDHVSARKEAVQVAAMAFRYLLDLG